MCRDKSVCVIIPAFDEEDSIGRVVSKTKELYPSLPVLVIDDGSKDKTGEIAKLRGAEVIRHPYNKGNGAAIKTGIRNANTDIIIILDADGQHDPKYIADMLPLLSEYDMVIGARSTQSMSLGRKVFNNAYNWMGTYLSGQKILDLTSGYRAVKRDVIIQFLPLLPNSYSSPTTSTMAFIKAGYNIKFFPMNVEARSGGHSKITPYDGFRFFTIIFRVATLFAPLRLFLPLSMMLFIFGLIWGGYNFVMYARFTNLSELLFVASIILFMLGLIAEQISMLRFSLIIHRQEHYKAE